MSDNFDNFDGNNHFSNSDDDDALPSSSPSNQYWDSDEALESLKMERSIRTEETNEQLTRRILEENGPAAAMSIVHIALHSQNDNTRLNAAKYIVDHITGEDTNAARQSWEDLVGDVVSQAEIFANSSGGTPPSHLGD